MISLYDYLSKIYGSLLDGKTGLNELPYFFIKNHSFEELINDDNLCTELILLIYNQDGETAFKPTNYNKARASHIIVTWLMGIGLAKYFKLDSSKSNFYTARFSNIWMQTAIYHDVGYMCEEVGKKDISLLSLTEKYNLLTNEYSEEFLKCLNGMENLEEFKEFFTYSYDEIMSYFEYSKLIHNDYDTGNGNEMCDHGIAGACISFSNYCKMCNKSKIKPSFVITEIQKISCIMTASHNIFKSNDEKSDLVYMNYNLNNLLSVSDIRVTENNKLLLLLSLVDTIECTKRFSKKIDPKDYLIQSTALKNVQIDDTTERLVIDFTNLAKYIEKNHTSKMLNRLLNHANAVKTIETWTSINSSLKGDNIYCIQLYK